MKSRKIWVGGALALLALCGGVREVLAQNAPSGAATIAVGPSSAPPPGGFPPGEALPGGFPPGGPPPGAPPGGSPPGFNIPPLPADAPEPSADPRNFDGTWFHENRLEFQMRTDLYGYPLPFTPQGKKVADRRLDSLQTGTPFINASSLCLPMGHPWQFDLNFPFQIFQTQDRLDILFEEYHGFVQVAMDPVKAAAPGYMGRSIGHWDGDTLVIETTGFKEGIWLDVNGTPASKNAKLTKRLRKVKSDHWYLEIVFTLDDPTYYTRPWSWVRDYNWRPDMMLFREYNCELQTGAKDGVDATLVPEPQD